MISCERDTHIASHQHRRATNGNRSVCAHICEGTSSAPHASSLAWRRSSRIALEHAATQKTAVDTAAHARCTENERRRPNTLTMHYARAASKSRTERLAPRYRHAFLSLKTACATVARKDISIQTFAFQHAQMVSYRAWEQLQIKAKFVQNCRKYLYKEINCVDCREPRSSAA
jgi:hypothetical protein